MLTAAASCYVDSGNAYGAAQSRKRWNAIGELFILGFFGKTIPAWLREFAGRYGLGGVILFDYSCQTQEYDNNIESPEQVQGSAKRFPRLPSHPMVFIDQEGGLVRRLKESRRVQAAAEREGIQPSRLG